MEARTMPLYKMLDTMVNKNVFSSDANFDFLPTNLETICKGAEVSPEIHYVQKKSINTSF